MYRIPLFQNAQWDFFMTASLPITTNERLFSINNATWEGSRDHGCGSLFSLSIENTCNYSEATVPRGVLAWICQNHTNTFSSDNATTVLKKTKTRFRLNNHILVFHNWQVLSVNIFFFSNPQPNAPRTGCIFIYLPVPIADTFFMLMYLRSAFL